MDNKVLIAGGGSRGLFFADIIANKLGKDVVAIAENHKPSHEIIKYRLKEFGTEHTQVFDSVESMLEATQDIETRSLFIMTPEWTHRGIFENAVKSGCHIFLEKPLATNRADTLEIEKLAKNTKKTVQVGFVLRSSAYWQKIKAIADSGVLGNIVTIQMNERMALQHGSMFHRTWHRKQEYTGGFINEKCCHDLDLMCWLKETQAKPLEIQSYGGSHMCPPKNTPEYCRDCDEKCPWRHTKINSLKVLGDKEYFDDTSAGIGRCVFHSDADVYDHQVLNLVFDDGSHCVFTVILMSGEPGRDISIHGTDGCLFGNMEQGKIKVHHYREDRVEQIELGDLDPHGGGDIGIVDSFLKAVESGEHPVASVEAGVRASMIAFAADDSVRTKQTVPINY